MLQCPALQPSLRCCMQIRSRNAAGRIREPLVPSAEQLPAGEHLHRAPANCKLLHPCTLHLYPAPCNPKLYITAPLHLYPTPCTPEPSILHFAACITAPQPRTLHLYLHPTPYVPAPCSLASPPLLPQILTLHPEILTLHP